MHFIRNITAGALAIIIGAGITANPVAADEVADFYKDKLVKIIIGSGAGGGYDTYARLVSRHLGRHVPGNPNIIAQNMNGAASIIATNYIMNVAPRDGSIIGGVQRTIALVQLTGRKGPKYKAEDIEWLGSLAKEAGVCAVATHTGVRSFDDAYTREFAMGGLGQNASEFWPAMFNNLLATKFKLVRGYPGTPQLHLAIQRKELDGVCQSWASFKEVGGKYVTDGNVKPLVQVALQPDPEMQRLGVPMLADIIRPDNLAKGQNLEDVRTFFKLTIVPTVMGRPFMMANGVPKARLDAMRKGFYAMVKDPKFLADAKRLRRDVELVTGEEIGEMVRDIAKTPAAKLAALNDHFKFKGKVEKVVLPIIVHAGKVVKIQRKGRRITIDWNGKKRRADVSGSRTAVMLNGHKVKRGAIKTGMNCTFHYYGHKTRAKKIECTN